MDRSVLTPQTLADRSAEDRSGTVEKSADAATLQALQRRVRAAIALLERIEADHAPAALAFSGGVEDSVLLHLIARHAPAIDAFVLDTGRLHAETHALIGAAEARYRRRIAVYMPAAPSVEAYVRINGINGFYESVAQRRACCAVRKIEPLARALQGRRAWLTGQRREQAPTRSMLTVEEWDAEHGLAKFNPLADWLEAELWAYARLHDVPVNVLHAHGYPSIGCAPCTRAVAPGESQRAGRWWWEDAAHKECGLHVRSVERARAPEVSD